MATTSAPAPTTAQPRRVTPLAAPAARPSTAPRACRGRRGGSGSRRSARRAPPPPGSRRPGGRARSRSGPCAPCGDGEDDDRQGPEVDAVGAFADPAHRPAADDRAEPRGRVGEGGDGEDRAEPEHGEPAAVEERRELGRCARTSARSRPGRRRRPPSIIHRACGAMRACRRRLGQTIASAAPISSSSARVSVP